MFIENNVYVKNVTFHFVANVVFDKETMFVKDKLCLLRDCVC